MFRKSFLTAAVLAGAALAFSSMSALAAPTDFQSCVSTTGTIYDISGKVTPSRDCAILKPIDANQNDSEALVNSKAFFGKSDWNFDGKEIEGSGSELISMSGGTASGTFTYTGTATSGMIMLVFKDGSGTNLVAYLLKVEDLLGGVIGSYFTPFVEPPFPLSGNSDAKQISHVSVYYRGGVTVPEPGTLALLGMGLVGFGVARRRRA